MDTTQQTEQPQAIGDSPRPKTRRGHWMQQLSPEERSERARKAGIASGKSPKHYRMTSEDARAAGRKGGRTISARQGHMAKIGRVGGLTAGGGRPKRERHDP
ncbi:MAG: stress-induced protein [Polyangia bacterium]